MNATSRSDEIEVTLSGDIEGMALIAGEGPVLPAQATPAYRADQPAFQRQVISPTRNQPGLIPPL
jgi:hypothetical protein